MTIQTSSVDLIAGYDAYATADELNFQTIHAASPRTTTRVCAGIVDYAIESGKGCLYAAKRTIPAIGAGAALAWTIIRCFG